MINFPKPKVGKPQYRRATRSKAAQRAKKPIGVGFTIGNPDNTTEHLEPEAELFNNSVDLKCQLGAEADHSTQDAGMRWLLGEEDVLGNKAPHLP